jgi:hypothetical protein
MSRRLKSLTAPWKPTGGRASADETGVGGTLAMVSFLAQGLCHEAPNKKSAGCGTGSAIAAAGCVQWICNTAAAAMQERRTKKAGASYRAPAAIAKLEECR